MYLRVNLLGPGPRLIKKKLPGRGLTKVGKHWPRECCLLHTYMLSVHIHHFLQPSLYSISIGILLRHLFVTLPLVFHIYCYAYAVVYVHEPVATVKDDRVKFLLVGHKDCFVVTPLIHVAAV